METGLRLRIISAYLTCALVWGTTWFAIRLSISPGGFPTYEAAALRFSLAVVIIAVLVRGGLVSLKHKLGGQLWWVSLAGLANAASYGLVYKGEESIPGSVASVVFGALPLVTAICAAATRTERISSWQISGALVALAGIATIFWDRLHISPHQALAVILVFSAVIANALYLIILKRKAPEAHSMQATGVFLAATAAGLWVFTLARGLQQLPWPLPAKPTVALIYLSIAGSVVAFSCYLYLLKHVGVITVSSLVIIEPVIALFVAHVWEHALKLSRLSYLGAAVTLAGLLISLLLKPTAIEGK